MNYTKPEVLTPQTEMAAFKPLFKTRPFGHAMAMSYNWLVIFVAVYLYEQLGVTFSYGNTYIGVLDEVRLRSFQEY